jgi:hypothetical protein
MDLGPRAMGAKIVVGMRQMALGFVAVFVVVLMVGWGLGVRAIESGKKVEVAQR